MKDTKNYEVVDGEEVNEGAVCEEQNPEKAVKFRRLKNAWGWIKEHKGKVVVTGITVIGGILVLTYALVKSTVSGEVSEDLNAEGLESGDSGDGSSDQLSSDSVE